MSRLQGHVMIHHDTMIYTYAHDISCIICNGCLSRVILVCKFEVTLITNQCHLETFSYTVYSAFSENGCFNMILSHEL